MFQLFLWIIYTLGILEHLNTKKLYMKTCCNSKSLYFNDFFLPDFWAQNVSIPPDQNMPQGPKCSSLPKLKIIPQGRGQNISIPPSCILITATSNSLVKGHVKLKQI